MKEDSRPTSRRRFLAALGLTAAGAASAGCSGLSGSDGTPTGKPPDGSQPSDNESTAVTTTTVETDQQHSDPLRAFETLLVDRFVAVRKVRVEDGRVRLIYVAGSERDHEVADGVETVVVSFIEVYREGWDVEAIDATLMDPHNSKEEMGRWRLEARWVESMLDSDWSRTDLLRRTLNTYHGDLEQDPDHSHSGDESHTHDDETNHTHDDET